jgi:hypothetical protein
MRPRVVMIDMEGKVHVIKERETTESMNSLESTPKHLEDIKLK